MKKTANSFIPVAVLIIVYVLSGCQYDYDSPLPGTLDVRLKSQVTDTSLFNPQNQNNFVLKVNTVEAIRSDFVRATVYEDPSSIKRSPRTYNVYDVRARDSSLVIGESPLPPGEYISVNLEIVPGPSVVRDGYRIINVKRVAGFSPILRFQKPFSVEEQGTTTIVVTVDLDSTLVPGVDFASKEDIYYFKPYYYISSINNH
ncbi:MAG: hypothetical protein HY707_01270 [Ignavibacteriae bacterium]|nr:hypothetical protein [Ignavibacteriota bacterium]